MQGAEVWIEEVNGNKVDEVTLSESDDRIHCLLLALSGHPNTLNQGLLYLTPRNVRL